MNREEVKKILLECGFKYSALMEVAAQQIIDRIPSQSSESGEGWVSVDDRKPEINIESYNSDYSILVLGLSESGIQSGFFHKDKHSEFYSEDTESLVVGVTHWMYKPQPPTLTDH